MKNKQGFTLIELLAVIVILAIILAIAVPSISKIIDNVRLNAFIDNEEMLVRSAKKMVGIDESYLPKEIGETKEVTLSELQAKKYIGAIISPNNKNQECNGYVLVTKLDNSKYDYTPYLNCISDIDSTVTDGLIGHWKLNGDAFDYSVNSNDGNIVGAVKANNRFDVSGKATSFNGSNQYVDLGNVNFNHTEFSVSVWVKSPTNNPSTTGFPIHVTNIIGKGSWNSTTNWYLGYRSTGTEPATNLSFVYGKIFYEGVSYSVTKFDLSKWNHFVGVATANEHRLYLNGDLVASVQTTHGSVTNSYPLQIGRSSYTTRYFNGMIDDIYIYKRALSSDEIKQMYVIQNTKD